ncbi:MAG: hypothetical protein LC627_03005, partial [Verrucomicrobiaceae bacterium]|nr:hypothetical protein [Verrucomicrobiaceae bacterium]
MIEQSHGRAHSISRVPLGKRKLLDARNSMKTSPPQAEIRSIFGVSANIRLKLVASLSRYAMFCRPFVVRLLPCLVGALS